MTDDPATTTAPDDPIAGGIRQAASELARISARLDAGVPPTEATAAILIALSHEIRETASVITRRPADHDDGTRAVRSFLVAVQGALDIPAPATEADQRAYWRTRSRMADEVLRAAGSIIGSRSDPAGHNWLWAGAQLAEAARTVGTDGYAHAPARPEVSA